MVAFLKACAPIAYTDYGKAISHYGGLLIAPLQAVEYAGCGRAKQLAWDRAYDEKVTCATSATMTPATPYMQGS